MIPLLGVPPAPNGSLLIPAIQFNGAVAQSGSRSGITNTIYTSWIAAPENFGGLSGGMTFSGNSAAFSEALITLGTTPDQQTACAAKNGTWPATVPPLTRLWAAILKSTAGTGKWVTLPVNYALPFPIPLGTANQGVCLALLVSAGYPYLDAKTARYSLTQMGLTAWMTPNSQTDPGVLGLGLGGEFRFVTGNAQALTTFVGIEASRPLLIDGVAGAVSASAVVGAPPGSPWLPAPGGLWNIGTSFEYFPAAICAKSGFKVQPSNGVYSIIRRATPAPFTLPAGTTSVVELPLWGNASAPVQLSAFKGFGKPQNGNLPGVHLATGDCLIAIQSMAPSPGQIAGVIDYENQSTVYIRLAQ